MSEGLRIRCYCHGFGDCFLLSFGDTGAVHMLIDCGVGSATDQREKRLDEVRRDILSVTGGVLAVLAVTHEHYDHLSGFAETSFWEQMNVGEVWMPWCDDPENDLAREFEERKKRAMEALSRLAVRSPRDISTNLRLLLELNGFEGMPSSLGSSTLLGLNFKMRELQKFVSRLSRDVRYLPPGELGLTVPGTSAEVKVLGPSFRLEELKAKHLNISLSGMVGEIGSTPNDEKGVESQRQSERDLFWGYRISTPDQPTVLSGKDSRNTWDRYFEKGSEWRRLEAGQATLEEFALQATGYINNLSLVLLIEYNGRLLLFPGDAEKESWRTWAEVLEAYSGEHPKTLAGLFKGIHFYKGAHHGSVNGTVWAGAAEYLDPRCLSFTPVEQYSNWAIPSATYSEKMGKMAGAVFGDDPLKAVKGSDGSKPVARGFGKIAMGPVSPTTKRPLYVDFLFD